MGVSVAGGRGGVEVDITAEVIVGAGKTFVVLVMGDVLLPTLACRGCAIGRCSCSGRMCSV